MNFECPACRMVCDRTPKRGRKTIDSFCVRSGKNVRLRRTRRRLSK